MALNDSLEVSNSNGDKDVSGLFCKITDFFKLKGVDQHSYGWSSLEHGNICSQITHAFKSDFYLREIKLSSDILP